MKQIIGSGKSGWCIDNLHKGCKWAKCSCPCHEDDND